MPADERELAFDIDVEKWWEDWEPDQYQVGAKKGGAKQVGYFSRVDGKVVPNSRKNLFDYKKPKLGTTLKRNDYEEFRKQDGCWCSWKDWEPHRLCDIDVLDYDINTTRNVLVRLGMALYKSNNSFSIDAVAIRKDESVFALFTKPKSFSKQESDMVEYLGAKFEVLCTGQKSVDRNSSFCSFISHKIGRCRVLLTAKIDCKDGSTSKEPPMNYIELKSRLETGNENRFRHKYMRYWLQSYLTGIPRIIEGVRDDKRKLLWLEEFKTSKIPELCRQDGPISGREWNETATLDFLAYTLRKIFKLCRKNPRTVVRVEFKAAEQRLTASLISNCERAKLFKDEISGLVSDLRRREDRKSTGNHVRRKSSRTPVEPERRHGNQEQECWPWRLLMSCWHITLQIFLLFVKQV